MSVQACKVCPCICLKEAYKQHQHIACLVLVAFVVSFTALRAGRPLRGRGGRERWGGGRRSAGGRAERAGGEDPGN